MKIYIICSKHFYDRIPPIKEELERTGHEIMLPSSYEDPFKEESVKAEGLEAHVRWKADMIRLHGPRVGANDAVLVLNFEKRGQPNYIGGATFLEIYKAWELQKHIFLYNPLPEGIFTDELKAFAPVVINGDLSRLLTTPS